MPKVASVPPTKTFELTKVYTYPRLLTEHFAPVRTRYACFGTRFQWSRWQKSGIDGKSQKMVPKFRALHGLSANVLY